MNLIEILDNYYAEIPLTQRQISTLVPVDDNLYKSDYFYAYNVKEKKIKGTKRDTTYVQYKDGVIGFSSYINEHNVRKIRQELDKMKKVSLNELLRINKQKIEQASKQFEARQQQELDDLEAKYKDGKKLKGYDFSRLLKKHSFLGTSKQDYAFTNFLLRNIDSVDKFGNIVSISKPRENLLRLIIYISKLNALLNIEPVIDISKLSQKPIKQEKTPRIETAKKEFTGGGFIDGDLFVKLLKQYNIYDLDDTSMDLGVRQYTKFFNNKKFKVNKYNEVFTKDGTDIHQRVKKKIFEYIQKLNEVL